MQMQLPLDFTNTFLVQEAIIQNELWLDVSEIAQGVGFTTTVQVSIALDDALQPLQNETESDYDQRLYDALWRAHFRLSLDPLPSPTFNFTYPRKDWKTKKISEISLRLRVKRQEQVVQIGLLQDY